MIHLTKFAKVTSNNILKYSQCFFGTVRTFNMRNIINPRSLINISYTGYNPCLPNKITNLNINNHDKPEILIKSTVDISLNNPKVIWDNKENCYFIREMTSHVKNEIINFDNYYYVKNMLDKKIFVNSSCSERMFDDYYYTKNNTSKKIKLLTLEKNTEFDSILIHLHLNGKYVITVPEYSRPIVTITG